MHYWEKRFGQNVTVAKLCFYPTKNYVEPTEHKRVTRRDLSNGRTKAKVTAAPSDGSNQDTTTRRASLAFQVQGSRISTKHIAFLLSLCKIHLWISSSNVGRNPTGSLRKISVDGSSPGRWLRQKFDILEKLTN